MSDQQELANASGVGEGQEVIGAEGAVTQGAQPIATESQPIASDGQHDTPAKIDLTALPEFRAYQASMDRAREEAKRREALLQQQLQAAQAQQEQMMHEFEAIRLKGADPEEAVEFLQTQLAQERQSRAQAAQQQAAATDLNERATKMLEDLGLDWDTPGLDLSGGATPEGYRMLLESAVRVAGKRASDEAARLKAEAEEAARRAAQTTQVEVARQLGATTISTTTGPGAPDHDFFQGEKDPVKRLEMALRAKRK